MTSEALHVGRAPDDKHREVAAYIAAAQALPERHITYLGEDPDSILDELSEADRWAERLIIATDEDRIAGAVLADVDADMRRVWWLGPWADSIEVASKLMAASRRLFGAHFDEEEMAPDSRNTDVRSLAARLGFREDTWSSVLSKPDLDSAGAMRSVRLPPEVADAVAVLHDRLFAGTHTTGVKLVVADGTRIRVIATDGAPVAYIAYEVQPDGTGYIDYLGVSESHRRRGLGRALVADVCRELASQGVPSVHLTVRADAAGAIDLYRSEGFQEDRRIVPCRSGFTLG